MAEAGQATYMRFLAYGGTPATTDTTGSLGAVSWFVMEHDGSNGGVDMASGSNAFTWGEVASDASYLTRMILKADDGELHLGNTTLVALDDEDDAQIVRAMQLSSASEGIIPSRHDNPMYSYSWLLEHKLAGEKDAEGSFLFPLQSRLHVHEGAIWQSYIRQQELAEKVALVEQKLIALGAG